MEADGGQSKPTPVITALPLTAAIARRVRQLRAAADMRGSGLASKLNELGVPWNRTTIAKFETGQRASISVQELLALAVALDVPPVWLLTDPKGAEQMPVASGGTREIELEPWSALLWLVGREPLDDIPGARFTEARAVLVELQRLAQALNAIRATDDIRAGGGGLVEGDDRRAEDVRLLQGLQRPLELLVKLGYPAPALPDDVLERARALQIPLPGRGG